MSQFKRLAFIPLPGCSSPHIQTIIASLLRPGISPPSNPLFITLNDGDILCCEDSIPSTWKLTQQTIVLLHGLCGNHDSNYMVRVSRKLFQLGYRAVRVNMRSCGSGSKLARLPYHGGVSVDLLQVLTSLKQQHPNSPIILIGFSLGGNIVAKLAAELGEKASELIKTTIAICAPLNLSQTADILSKPENRLYNRYYLHKLNQQASRWIKDRSFSTISEFDNLVTAPQWGFKDAHDYYEKCSSYKLLPQIKHPCHFLYSEDDPFVDYRVCLDNPLSSHIKIWLTSHGGHMGFFGWTDEEHRYFWLDRLLINWVKGEF